MAPVLILLPTQKQLPVFFKEEHTKMKNAVRDKEC